MFLTAAFGLIDQLSINDFELVGEENIKCKVCIFTQFLMKNDNFMFH
jgi:hypothetical protein